MGEQVEYDVDVTCRHCDWKGKRSGLKGLEACICPCCAEIAWPPKPQPPAKCERCTNLSKLLTDERKAHAHAESANKRLKTAAISARKQRRASEKLIEDAIIKSPGIAETFRLMRMQMDDDTLADRAVRGRQRRKDNSGR